VTVVVLLFCVDCESVTTSVEVKLPAAVYTWVGFATVEVPPSPKVQAYVYEPKPPVTVLVNVTSRGATPEVGFAEIESCRGGAVTVTVSVAVAIMEPLSAAVT